MKVILLTILVGIAPVESSSEYNLSNSMGLSDSGPLKSCEYGKLHLQPFEEITSSSLRSFLLDEVGEIANTECVQFYQVMVNNDENPLYFFRIDRQDTTDRLWRLEVCGVVTVNDSYFVWTACDDAKYYNYLETCAIERNKPRHPKEPPVVSCNQTSTFTPRDLTPQVAPATISPRAVANEKSTTRKGWLRRLTCITCA